MTLSYHVVPRRPDNSRRKYGEKFLGHTSSDLSSPEGFTNLPVTKPDIEADMISPLLQLKSLISCTKKRTWNRTRKRTKWRSSTGARPQQQWNPCVSQRIRGIDLL